MIRKRILPLLLALALLVFSGCSQPQPQPILPDLDSSQITQVSMLINDMNPARYLPLSQEEIQQTLTWLEELEGVPQSDPKTEHYIGMPTLYRFTQKDGSEFYLIFEEGKNYNLVLQIQNSESCYTISEEQRAPWLDLANEYLQQIES